jgi:hypothetical protein
LEILGKILDCTLAPAVFQNFITDILAYVPVHIDETAVYGFVNLGFGFLNYGEDFGKVGG